MGKIVTMALVASLLFWVVDAVVDSMASPDVGFWATLATDVRPSGVLRRVLVLIVFAGYGLVVSRAATEPKAAALRASEERHRKIVETAQEGIWLLDADTNTTFVNERLAEMLGYTVDEMLGRPLLDFMHSSSQDNAAKHLERTTQTSSARHDLCLRRRDGSDLWVLMSTGRMQDDAGAFIGALAMVADLTERKQMEVTLRESEARNRALVDAMPDLMFRIREDGTFLDFKGDQHELLLPAERVIGSKMADLPMPEETKSETMVLLHRAVASAQLQEYEYELAVPSGTQTYNARLVKSGPDEAVCIVRNVTEQRRLEARLRETSKMEAVGTLAGGVAHDFNNILQGIVGYAHFVLQRVGDEATRRDVTQIQRLTARAADLVGQLLAFSRKQMLHTKAVDLNRLVRNLLKMLARIIGEDIELRLNASGDLCAVRADPGQIEQVLMNLASNARDAMPQGGILTIQTDSVDLTDGDPGQALEVGPGTYARITVSDSGLGMDDETVRHAFEPFYTTKEAGKGSGLGLASVYGVVKQHHGDVTVTSEVGKGTTFQVYLPCVDASPEAPLALAEAGDGPRGTETILVAEDNETVRTVIRRNLAHLGYTVLCGANGDEAAEAFERHADEIDLLLTDVVMPGGSGRQLYGRLAGGRPSLKVLYMSGFDEEAVAQYGVPEQGMAFIRKPIDINELAREVREVLDSDG